jgi:hypothetical protein
MRRRVLILHCPTAWPLRQAYPTASSTVVSSRLTLECREGCPSPISCAPHLLWE